MNKELLATLRSSISENDSHAARIGKAKEALKRLFPLTAASFVALDDTSVMVLDQFLYP